MQFESSDFEPSRAMAPLPVWDWTAPQRGRPTRDGRKSFLRSKNHKVVPRRSSVVNYVNRLF